MPASVSRSSSVSQASSLTSGVSSCSRSTERTIVDFCQIETLISPLQCPHCLNSGLRLCSNDGHRKGLAIKLQLYCSFCAKIINSDFTSTRTPDKSFRVNESAVSSSLLCGFGPYTFNKLCEHLDLPGIHQKSFNNRAKSFYDSSKDIEVALQQKTVHLVRQQHAQVKSLNLADDEILDIAVSYDGSWMTRGHSSMIGIGCVIDVLTGYVVDFHVMSSFCQTCAKTGQKLKESNPRAYTQWYEKHKLHCDINYSGSAGMMETHAAELLWSRSIKRHKLRYTTMLSDGDAKSFNRLTEIAPYPGTVIEKEECINHVGKRLSTSLRNLVSDCSKRRITLGGNGYGRLTNNAIRKLSIYYTRAIRKHKNVEDMRKAILASIYHGFSTDARPLHHLCPTGTGSWCFYNAAIANHQKPGKHVKCLRTPLNYTLLASHIKPIYQRLADPKLLQRCLLSATQNANESLHSVIWSNRTKARFSSFKKVKFSALSSIGEFNFGVSATSELKESLELSNSHNSQRLGLLRQKKRLDGSAYKQKKVVQHRLQSRRAAKVCRELELKDTEGITYAPGQF
ncbi:hypothetical protein ElyMa_006430500 [Elysia marginata]|uniref:Mutator-like transposase domain-containing protein n=1 Tax=Elysia marginata TaxID=1093978 RepID=A0AAV4HWN9_9GAST|nr:hypothetical protein ElyMa_006430500 [Elysia marginata]